MDVKHNIIYIRDHLEEIATRNQAKNRKMKVTVHKWTWRILIVDD
uniref:Response regulatory domain-containing protein n=1 Tax=Heterorhabditis bacteriophora TaxID=37862 RepID=A0A1I7WTU9_HETBA